MKKIIFLMILTFIIFTGCEKTEEIITDGEIVTSEYKGMTVVENTGYTNVYSADEISFMGSYLFMRETHMHNMFVINDRFYVVAPKSIIVDDGYYDDLFLLSYDLNGEDLFTIKIPSSGERTSVRFAWYDTNFDLISIEEVNYEFTLYKRTFDGDVIFSHEIEITDNDILAMVIGENDNIYIATHKEVVIFANNGEFIASIPLNSSLVNMTSAHGKKPILKFNDVNTPFKCVNTEKKLLEDIEIPMSDFRDVNIFYGEGYDYYYYNDKGLYGYNIEENLSTQVLDWINSDINMNNIKSFTVISPEKMVMITNIGAESSMFLLNKISDDQLPQKEIIKLGLIANYDDRYLNELITSFNKYSQDYRIQLINYYSEEFGIESYQKFNTAIAAGNTPDLLYMNGYFPQLNYINKNMFVDLDPYLDSVPEIKDNLLPFVTENTRIKNKLTQLITNFRTQSLVTRSENIKDGKYLSIEKLLEIYKSLPYDVLLYPDSEKAYLQAGIIMFMIPECVDYDNGTCDFNLPEMKTFLEMLKLLSDKPSTKTNDIDGIIDLINRTRNGEFYFYNATIYDYQSYIVYTKKTFMPDESYVSGYPTMSGKKRGDWIISYGFSILNSSDKKDIAWEFIKYSLSENFYKNQNNKYYTIPIKGSIEYELSGATRNGREFTYINTTTNPLFGIYAFNTNVVDEKTHGQGIFYNTEDLVNEYMTYLETLNNYVYNDDNIANIMNEEISTYLNSTKTVDDTIKAIQSRVSIYMSEMWG